MSASLNSARVQAYAAKLKGDKSFLRLILVNVAAGINQFRLQSDHSRLEGNKDVVNLYGETERIGALDKRSIQRLERRFRSVLKTDEFWHQTATWILVHLDQWQQESRMPSELGVLSIMSERDMIDSDKWRESSVTSACAWHTASQWLRHLNLPTYGASEIDKLLGIETVDSEETREPLFQDADIERVATGYPILTGAQALINSQWENGEYPYWKKLVGGGFIQHNIVRQSPSSQQMELVPGQAAWEIIKNFGPEAAYVFLIFASYATDSEEPWADQIRLQGTDLIRLFGWDKRTDITIAQKLKKIGSLVELVCSLAVLVSNINIGEKRYNVERGAMWILEGLGYSGQLALTVNANRSGSPSYEPGEPDELYIKVRPGIWTEKFLNASDVSAKEALFQYGYLAKSTLQINPYRQRLASKLAIFLTIMSRIREEGRYEVRTLLERLEPTELLEEIRENRVRRTKVINQWDSALLTLKELGWEIGFDPATYPESIRPAWAVSDEVDATSYRPRNWLATWLKAIVIIKPSEKIQEKLEDHSPVALKAPPAPAQPPALTGEAIQAALDAKGMTKAELADKLNVDRSLVTRWLKGQRKIQPKHQAEIKLILGDLES
ncbi:MULTISPECIES: helix-turn-helix domain-containing protein [Leptolyngbya]|nr:MULTISPECIES: helix-turn-helix transcriptional regulator [Leptolyngbya]MBD2371154.1 helix-turn-helix transcriptional regulator [Leptolyngbya sp. FACHB-161]MBD2377622.1 helix-turn-helix transcriptional regulator [Leptolyngbya sp. FACHB-238]MBD2402048.1 helix-turn-helix transcriptional regulator [Leptolyngbya sp. FACHB-239]MBD2408567.1 helix-turn-helix transcriptional regulator [Leptolyngbya sp. FACHB-402]ULP33807.1 helix-turn-helix domain-containing protein [Leptolyngbya boryana IU 594]